jgi:hypothetical protein
MPENFPACFEVSPENFQSSHRTVPPVLRLVQKTASNPKELAVIFRVESGVQKPENCPACFEVSPANCQSFQRTVRPVLKRIVSQQRFVQPVLRRMVSQQRFVQPVLRRMVSQQRFVQPVLRRAQKTASHPTELFNLF